MFFCGVGIFNKLFTLPIFLFISSPATHGAVLRRYLFVLTRRKYINYVIFIFIISDQEAKKQIILENLKIPTQRSVLSTDSDSAGDFEEKFYHIKSEVATKRFHG